MCPPPPCPCLPWLRSQGSDGNLSGPVPAAGMDLTLLQSFLDMLSSGGLSPLSALPRITTCGGDAPPLPGLDVAAGAAPGARNSQVLVEGAGGMGPAGAAH